VGVGGGTGGGFGIFVCWLWCFAVVCIFFLVVCCECVFRFVYFGCCGCWGEVEGGGWGVWGVGGYILGFGDLDLGGELLCWFASFFLLFMFVGLWGCSGWCWLDVASVVVECAGFVCLIARRPRAVWFVVCVSCLYLLFCGLVCCSFVVFGVLFLAWGVLWGWGWGGGGWVCVSVGLGGGVWCDGVGVWAAWCVMWRGCWELFGGWGGGGLMCWVSGGERCGGLWVGCSWWASGVSVSQSCGFLVVEEGFSLACGGFVFTVCGVCCFCLGWVVGFWERCGGVGGRWDGGGGVGGLVGALTAQREGCVGG